MQTYKQGDTIRLFVKIAYKGTGDPVNLAGCTARSQLRKKPGDSLKANGTVAIDTANGLVSATYTSAQTAVLEPGSYGFDIRLQTQGDEITLITKQITIVKPYTE